jgi:hypothetical protein
MTVLRRIFNRSGLRPPARDTEHGPPLYAYQVTDEELEELRCEVQLDLRQRMRMVGTPAGAFCLFAAEHLCRTYTGGPWRWQIVFDALRATPSQLDREAWVRAGMYYWHRPIVQTATQQRLLTTLVCEGGLPMHLLAEGRERYIKEFFRAVLRHAERLQVPAARVVEQHTDTLPRTLRNDTVADLGALLADAVIDLRRSLPVDSTEDPLSTLSRVRPDWRQTVPLRIHEAAFVELLRGLLRERRTAVVGDTPLEITTVLRMEPLRVERRVAAPERCSSLGLARLLNVPDETLKLHARITLSMLAANGERHAAAIARLGVDQTTYAVETLAGAAVGHEQSARAAVRIVANVGGRELACVEPPGGTPLLGSVPWVFEGGDRPVRALRRQGSYRASANDLLLAVPPNVAISSELPVIEVGMLGRQRLLRVEGVVRLRGDEDEWEVRTGSDDDDEDVSYALSGELHRMGFSGSEYWRGLPRLQLLRENGPRIDVAASEIEVRPAGQRSWRPAGSVWGDVELRRAGAAQHPFQTRLLLFPPDTDLEIDGRASAISVRSRELVAVVKDGVRQPATEGNCVLAVAPDESRSTLPLELEFSAGAAATSVPTPIRRAEFVGRDGPISGHVVVDLLGRIRARAMSPDTAERFGLEARIQGKVPWTQLVRLPSSGGSGGVWELSLDAVREQLTNLFALSYHLDEEVELRVSVYGSPMRTLPVLRVRRYEAKPHVSYETDAVAVELFPDAQQRIGPAGVLRLQLELRPLSAPDAGAVSLERSVDDDARWRIPRASLTQHRAWVLFGKIGDKVRLRPLVVAGDKDRSPESALEGLLFDGDKKRRREGLQALLCEIAPAWARPEWESVSHFLNTLGSLPATTFDLVDALSEVPAVAAGALIRCCGDAAALERVWRGLDELPFLWETLPLDAWVATAAALQTHARHLSEQSGMPVAQLVPLVLRAVLNDGPRMSKFFEAVHCVLYQCLEYCPPPATDYISVFRQPASEPMLNAILAAQVQELRRRHEDEWWPTDLTITDEAGKELEGHAWLAEGMPAYCRPVISAPLQAGVAAGYNRTIGKPSLLALRRVRTFDPVWFEFAHALGFTFAAAQRLPPRS